MNASYTDNPWLETPNLNAVPDQDSAVLVAATDHNPWLDDAFEEDTAMPETPDALTVLDSLNPTGSVTVEYDPTARANAPLTANMTTLAQT